MKRDHLGDALDHWKGSLLESLREAHLLTDPFWVDAMVSDHPWRNDEFAVYSNLLRVETQQIIAHKFPLMPRQNRREYFSEIIERGPGDVFLDPDTGIARESKGKKHVTITEIDGLLRARPGQLVIVYQHKWHDTITSTCSDLIMELCGICASVQWCSYESTEAAMLFHKTIGAHPKIAHHFIDSLRCSGSLGQDDDPTRRIRSGPH